MKERDIKLLWGRAGGLCSICRCKLTENPTAASKAFPLGEQAHIVAECEDGPRGKSLLDEAARDGYTNRILLCPTHHTVIDKAEADFPVELLHVLKRDHELWVEQQLGTEDEAALAAQEIYSSLLDAAIEAGELDDWKAWTSWVLGVRPHWRVDGHKRIYRFRQLIIGAAWPGVNDELERALKTFSIYLNASAQRFLDESKDEGDFRVEVKAHKLRWYDQEVYDMLVARWERWQDDVQHLMLQVTKAANWLADVVRRDLNPRFFSLKGKFVIEMQEDLHIVTLLPEFTEEEKATLPDSIPDDDLVPAPDDSTE